jgi:hypothetical protein
LLSGRLTSSNVATWVLSAQDSNTAPQTSQDTWPLCGIKHVGSMRSYSAPHSHRTSVLSILKMSVHNHPFPVWILTAPQPKLYCRSSSSGTGGRPCHFWCRGWRMRRIRRHIGYRSVNAPLSLERASQCLTRYASRRCPKSPGLGISPWHTTNGPIINKFQKSN